MVKKNLKEYSKKFDEMDSKQSGAAAQNLQATRKKLLDEWTTWRNANLEQYAKEREERARLRGSKDEPIYSDVESDDDGEEIIEDWMEQVIEETIELV